MKTELAIRTQVVEAQIGRLEERRAVLIAEEFGLQQRLEAFKRLREFLERELGRLSEEKTKIGEG